MGSAMLCMVVKLTPNFFHIAKFLMNDNLGCRRRLVAQSG